MPHIVVSGKKTYESFDSKRQMVVDRPDWIVVRDTYEGIVMQEKISDTFSRQYPGIDWHYETRILLIVK